MKKPKKIDAPEVGAVLTKAAPAAANVPAKAESKAVVVSSGDDGFGDFAGMGTETVTAKDVLIPRLTLLQALSPQLNKKKAEYIEGGEIGDICDVAMGQIFKGSILFLPVLFKKQWLQWAPRSTGKGLVGVHENDSILSTCKQNEKGQWINGAGDLIAETASFTGYNISAGLRKSFIPMASSNLKIARKWVTMSTGEILKRPDGSTFCPPLFYRVYELSAVESSNAEGDWSSWNVTRGMSLPEIPEELIGMKWQDLRDDCVKFHKAISSGALRADHSDDEQDGGADRPM